MTNEQKQKFCHECGAELLPNAKFCGLCGTKTLKLTDSMPEPVSAEEKKISDEAVGFGVIRRQPPTIRSQTQEIPFGTEKPVYTEQQTQQQIPPYYSPPQDIIWKKPENYKKRVFEALITPGKGMKTVARAPDYLIPALIIIIIGLSTGLAYFVYINESVTVNWVDTTDHFAEYDTSITNDTKEENAGGIPLLKVGLDGSNHSYALLKFDLSQLSGIKEGILKLYCDNVIQGNFKINIYIITEDWQDNVTWSTIPAYNSNVNTTIDIGTNSGWVEANITEILQDWEKNSILNYGLLLGSDATSDRYVNLSSKEGNTNPLKLSITATAIPPKSQKEIWDQIPLSMFAVYIVMTSLSVLVATLILHIALGFVGKIHPQERKFKQSFSILGYSQIPNLIYAIISIPLIIMLKEPQTIYVDINAGQAELMNTVTQVMIPSMELLLLSLIFLGWSTGLVYFGIKGSYIRSMEVTKVFIVFVIVRSILLFFLGV